MINLNIPRDEVFLRLYCAAITGLAATSHYEELIAKEAMGLAEAAIGVLEELGVPEPGGRPHVEPEDPGPAWSPYDMPKR